MKIKITKAYIYYIIIFSFFYYNFLESCCFSNRVDVAAQDLPFDVAFSPDGTCAVVSNRVSNTLSIYNVSKDASDNCVLTPSNPATVATGDGPLSIAFSPDGTCVLVANSFSASLSIYNVSKDINGNCVLTPSNPATIAVGDFPFGLAFSPDGTCVVLSNGLSDTISIYNVTSAGGNCTLTPSNPATVTAPDPRALTFSPDGTCLAVGTSTSLILSIFNVTSVNGNCTLTPSTPATVPAGHTVNEVAFSPDGTCLVALNQANQTLTIYNVTSSNNNCIVTPSTQTSIAVGPVPIGARFSPDGRCVFASSEINNNISTFTVSNVNGNCTLTPSNTINTGTFPARLAFTPDGNCLAVPNGLLNGVVNIFRITVLVNITASNPVLCPNDQVILTANVNGGQAPYTYQWFQDGSEIIGATSDMLVVTTPGTYSVTVTDANGCDNTASFAVPLAPAISVNITPVNPVICNNNPVMLTASVTGGAAPFSYQWLLNGNPVGTDSPILLATTPGNYSVIVTDANSCSVTSSLTTIVEDNISVAITPNNPNACPNANLTANITDGVGPFIFEWTLNGATISTSQTITVTTSGDYSVTVTDANGCSVTDSLNITVDTIAVNISVDDPCLDNPTLTANVIDGIAPFSYQWLFNGNPVGTDSPILVVTTSGDYSVIVTDANGCSSTDSLNIILNTIAVTISVDDLCKTNPTLTASVTGGIAPFSYQWLFNGNPVGTDSPILVVTESGDYSVTVIDANNCTTNSSIVINADNITATISSINLNLCTALLTANITGGIAPFSYQWFFNGAPIVGETRETLTITASGDYSVIVTDTNGCIASDTFNITLGDCCIKPDANNLSRAICQKYRNQSYINNI